MTTANSYELPKIMTTLKKSYSNNRQAWMYWEDGTSLSLSGPTNSGAHQNKSSITSIIETNSSYAYANAFPQLTGFTGSIKYIKTLGNDGYLGCYMLTTTGQLWGLGYVWLAGIPGYISEVGTAQSSRTDNWTLLRDDVEFIDGLSYSSYGERLVTLQDGTLWSACGYNSNGRLGLQSLDGNKDTSNSNTRTVQSYKSIVSELWTTVVRAWAVGSRDQIMIEDADGAFWLQGYHHGSYLVLAQYNGNNAHSWKASTFNTTGVMVTSTSSMDLTGFNSIIKITAEGSFPTGTTTKYAISLDGKATWVIPNGSSTTSVADASAGCDLAALETFDFVSNPSNTLHVQLWLQTSDTTLSPQVDRVSLWTTIGGRVVQSYVNFEVEEVGANIVKITNTGSTEKTYQLKVNHT
jgi:hypothetical protein